MNEIADRLNAPPSRRDIAEHVPGRLAQPIGLAVAAAHEVDEALVGQIRHGEFPCARDDRVGLAPVFDRRVAPKRQVAGRRDKPAAAVAEEIMIGGRRDFGHGEDGFGHADIGLAIFVHRQQTHQRRRLGASEGDFIAVTDQHP